jgi:hypothetical protein
MRRLASLTVDLAPGAIGLAQLALAADALAPSLTSLELDASGNRNSGLPALRMDNPSLAWLGSLRRLRSLTLELEPWCGGQLSPPWLQTLTDLTRLEVGWACVTPQIAAAVLGPLASLRELQFECWDCDASAEALPGSASGVTRLRLLGLDWQALSALTRAFPAVRDAELRCLWDGDYPDGVHVDPLPQSGWRDIQRLDIRGDTLQPLLPALRLLGALGGSLKRLEAHIFRPVDDADFLALLAASPALEELHLARADLSDAALEACTALPGLRQLSLGYRVDPGAPWGPSLRLTVAGLLALGRAFPGLREEPCGLDIGSSSGWVEELDALPGSGGGVQTRRQRNSAAAAENGGEPASANLLRRRGADRARCGGSLGNSVTFDGGPHGGERVGTSSDGGNACRWVV